MKKVRINRKKWLRGNKNNNGNYTTSVMRNPKGQMCCLGFVCKAFGVTPKALTSLPTPSAVRNHFGTTPSGKNVPSFLVQYLKSQKWFKNTQKADRYMTVNDNELLNEEKREEKLKKMFAKENIEVEFFG